MIRIEVDGGSVRTCADSRDGFKIAGELAFAVRGIYLVLSQSDETTAEAFRFTLSRLLGEGGRAWDADAAAGRGFCVTAAPPGGADAAT